MSKDVIKVTFYSVCGVSCAFYSIHSLVNAYLQRRKIVRMAYTGLIQQNDLSIADYQVVRNNAPLGYYKLQGRLSSTQSVMSNNGIQCLYYEKNIYFSHYESNKGINSQQLPYSTPLYIQSYNVVVDSICYGLFYVKRVIQRYSNPFEFHQYFAESSGTMIERKSCDLILTTFDGIRVRVDLTGCCLELNEFDNEKILLPSDSITAIGYVYMKDNELVLCKPLLKWYILTNKQPQQLIKSWWQSILWLSIKGLVLGACTVYCYRQIDMFLTELRLFNNQPILPIQSTIIDSINNIANNDNLEWILKLIRVK